MLHTCRIFLGLIGGLTVVDNPLIGVPIFMIGLALCFVQEK